MDDSDDPILRIRHKLPLAAAADPGRKVFGASSHRYQLGPPATEDMVREFEARHAIVLPPGYRRFLLEVGNGGAGTEASGAGPYYGIYPLGVGVAELGIDQAPSNLPRRCVVSPRMPASDWQAVLAPFRGVVGRAAYDEGLATVLGGLLPIGTQGCLIFHGLVLNGPFVGRVVNFSLESDQPPQFAFERDFLAWYERWLDEAIAGELFETPTWFGYVPGGSPDDLLAGFRGAPDEPTAQDFLAGLLAKPQLQPVIVDALLRHPAAGAAQRAALCRVVCKSDFARAEPLLAVLAQEDPLAFLQCLHWYAGDRLAQWEGTLLGPGLRIDEDKAFAFFTYVLEKLDVDRAAYLMPHVRSGCAGVRAQAFYALGKVADKAKYVDCFVLGLADESTQVVRNTLQALKGVRDPALIPRYRALAARFPVERDYILVNLDHRFKEFGLSRTAPAATPVVTPARMPDASPAASLGARLGQAWRRLTS